MHNRHCGKYCVLGCDVVCFGRNSIAFTISYFQGAEYLVTVTVQATLPGQRRQIAALEEGSGTSGALLVFEANIAICAGINECLAF